MKTLFLFIFHTIIFISYAQNLVKNPSFEDYRYIPEHLGNFNKNVDSWSTPNLGSTDFYHTESAAVGTINFFGNQKPITGKSFIGIYLLAPKNYREYIQGEIIIPLIKNQKYQISFNISLAENSNHVIKNLGVLFLQDSLKQKTDEVIDIHKILNQIPNSHFTLINSEQFYTQKDSWEKVVFEYTAKGFEQVFIIGNFDTNKKIEKSKIQKTKKPDVAYYYLEDISIEPFNIENEKQKPETLKVMDSMDFENDKIYTLKNVLFEFNKHQLLDVSKTELNKLFNYLNKHKHLQIEIQGHTDNVGTTQRNNQLSLLRAKEVALYLIKIGLKPERITATGYGNKYPIATNTTEKGRALNRRVAFKLSLK